MKGFEMMLANMIGISPEQMRTTFEGLANAASNGAEMLKRIEAQNDEIISLLKGRENDNGNGTS